MLRISWQHVCNTRIFDESGLIVSLFDCELDAFFIHLCSCSSKISQEVPIVTSALLMPIFLSWIVASICVAASSGGLRCHSHIFQGMVVQEMLIFSNTILASSVVSARKNPYPCLTPALGPTNTHLYAPLCPSLPGTTEIEKSTERKNPVFPGQEWFFFFFCFCLGLLVSMESFVNSLVRFPLSLSSQSPPGRCVGFTCFSSTSCALWGPDCSRPGAWSNFPLASFLL